MNGVAFDDQWIEGDVVVERLVFVVVKKVTIIIIRRFFGGGKNKKKEKSQISLKSLRMLWLSFKMGVPSVFVFSLLLFANISFRSLPFIINFSVEKFFFIGLKLFVLDWK